MTLYADRPVRLARQVVGDVLALVLAYAAVRLGMLAHDAVAALAVPGREAEEAARGAAGRLRGTAEDLDGAPLVGERLAGPFRDLAGTSRSLAESAQSYQHAVERLALLAGIVVAALPLLVVVAYAARRSSWVRTATGARRLAGAGPAATDLLAVRALATRPLRELARIDPAVVQGWRAGDPDAAAALAALELRDLGLRPRAA